MKPTAAAKMAVDILMTAALLFLMGYQLWGEAAHEWAGAIQLFLFLAHYALNRSWHRNLLKGRQTPMRLCQNFVDALLLIAMAAQMYSGIVMSRHVFAFLPIKGGMALARKLHILGAYWGLLLTGVHLGMHWNLVLGMIKRRAGVTGFSKAASAAMNAAGIVIAAWGVWAFLRRDFMTYLFLRSEFVFLDYEEPAWSFYLDYVCLMGLLAFLSHWLSKGLRKAGSRNGKRKEPDT